MLSISVNLMWKFRKTGAVLPTGCRSLLDPFRTLVISVEDHERELWNLWTGLPGTTENNHSWNTSSRSGIKKFGVLYNAKFHEPVTEPYFKPAESSPHSSLILNNFVFSFLILIEWLEKTSAFPHSPNTFALRRCRKDPCSYHTRIPKQCNNFPASHTT
jgi:hypothetical protein